MLNCRHPGHCACWGGSNGESRHHFLPTEFHGFRARIPRVPSRMSDVETGQMSVAETGQMSAVETRQMSTIATGRCPVLILYICLVSTADICPVSAADICLVSTHNVEVSEVSTVPMLKSQKCQLWQCHNVQVAVRRSGPKSAKMGRNGSRIVART